MNPNVDAFAVGTLSEILVVQNHMVDESLEMGNSNPIPLDGTAALKVVQFGNFSICKHEICPSISATDLTKMDICRYLIAG